MCAPVYIILLRHVVIISNMFFFVGCHTLAGSGDCEFYRCVEDKYMTCGDEGYALKYGYKQCQATQDSYHQFNDEVNEILLLPVMDEKLHCNQTNRFKR